MDAKGSARCRDSGGRRPPRRASLTARTGMTELLPDDSAHSRESGNPAPGSPPARGRAVIGVTATLLLAAMLVSHWHRVAAAAEPDPAYAAFQRGYYVTAFALATERVEAKKDAKAMTLLGELYAGGLGIRHDDLKAAEWYKLAAERGDRNAMFALAM